MKKLISISSALLIPLVPAVVLAQTQTRNLNELVWKIIGYLNQALVLLMAFAVVMFVYYVINYFMKPDANRAEGGSYVLWSVIGFFVILSFWGLVNILQNTFGLRNEINNQSSWTSLTNIFPGGGSVAPNRTTATYPQLAPVGGNRDNLAPAGGN